MKSMDNTARSYGATPFLTLFRSPPSEINSPDLLITYKILRFSPKHNSTLGQNETPAGKFQGHFGILFHQEYCEIKFVPEIL